MSEKSEAIITYEPDNFLKKGYTSLIFEILHDFKENGWLTYQLFRRDFLPAYKQSFFGIYWSVIMPLFGVGTFVLLSRSGIFNSGNMSSPYLLYAVSGMAFWQLFSSGIIAGSASLAKAGPMIVKIKFSKKSLVIASTGQSLVSFLIQIVLVGGLFFYYGITPAVTIFLVPLAIIPLVLFTLGVSFILSVLNGIMRDIGNIISISVTFLMFLTPVLYAKPATGFLATITKYNPLYYLISVPRELLLTGKIREGEGFLVSVVISVVTFMICLLIFHLAETRIAERI